MTSLLELSVLLWVIPVSSCVAAAWMTLSVKSAATTRANKRCQTNRPLQLSSKLQIDVITTHNDKESLAILTVPELKEMLRSAGQKVTGKKSDLIERLLLTQQQMDVITTHDKHKESLAILTVPELKEKLRSAGQKVTGKKSELIERLLLTQQQISSGDTTTLSHGTINGVDENDDLDPSLAQLPEPLKKAFIKYASSSNNNTPSGGSHKESEYASIISSPKLLPIQLASYHIISKGEDCVLFSPTGTGKSLAFILPLAARLYGWKHDGSLQHKKDAQKQRFIQHKKMQNRDRNDSFSSAQTPVVAATPSILIVEPSRELARQVGKVWGKFHPTATKNSKRQVAIVFGGVPMQRHAALLGTKTDVVVGTPGRIRELIRDKCLSTAHLRSIVLDKADKLLNFKDYPEVEWLLDGTMNDCQLVLASSTINKRVEKFVGEVMELEVGEEGYVVVEGEGSGDDIGDASDGDGGISFDDMSDIDGVQIDVIDTGSDGSTETAADSSNGPNKTPAVRHWSMPASTASRITLTSDLIVTMAPRRGLVFVPSKAEAEAVAQELNECLSTANDVSIHILHGDMVQAARSRTVNSFRADSKRMTRIMVATDVAVRGLDLPAVDLVLQYGVPRKSGKDGTFDSELYIHRTGRAGRFGNTRTVDAILLYDRSQGEIATLNKLHEEMLSLKGVDIMPRQLPSPSEVMEASYNRVSRLCDEHNKNTQTRENSASGTQSLVQYFEDKLTTDLLPGGDNESFLIKKLATAMAALSGLESVVPPRSLLTADPRDRTIRLWNESCNTSNPLSPSEATKVVKALGSASKFGDAVSYIESLLQPSSPLSDPSDVENLLLVKRCLIRGNDDKSMHVPENLALKRAGGQRKFSHVSQYIMEEFAGITNNFQSITPPYSGHNDLGTLNCLPEFVLLDVTQKAALFELLSFPNLGKWDFNMFDVAAIDKENTLLFVAWAVIASPHSQLAMATELKRADVELSQLEGYNFVDLNLNMDVETLCHYIRAIQNDYRQENPFHNAIHAADVVQTLNSLIQMTDPSCFEAEDLLSIFLAAVVHDVKHPGMNNSFQVNSFSDLALKHNDVAVLENEHAAHAFKILIQGLPGKSDNLNFLRNAGRSKFAELRKKIIDAILQTDMAKHYSIVANIKSQTAGRSLKEIESNLCWEVLMFMLHLADISNLAKGDPLFKLWADRCLEEFFAQGDKEKEMGLPISPNCNRDETKKPESQIGFINFFVKPSYVVLAGIIPDVGNKVLPVIENNLVYWDSQKEEKNH